TIRDTPALIALEINNPSTITQVPTGRAHSRDQVAARVVEPVTRGRRGVSSVGESGTNHDQVRILRNLVAMMLKVPESPGCPLLARPNSHGCNFPAPDARCELGICLLLRVGVIVYLVPRAVTPITPSPGGGMADALA